MTCESEGRCDCTELPEGRLYERIDSPAVYLTFDDGPNPEVTPRLLRLLAKEKVKGTFFVSGPSIATHSGREILRMIADEGHAVGNHGLIHRRNACPMFGQMHDAILKVCGISTKLIRAPYGHSATLTNYLNAEKAAVAFHWSAEFRDFEPVDLGRARSLLPQYVAPGAIILLHDGVAPAALFKERGQVLELTKSILDYCGRNGLPVRGLDSEFPEAYSPE